MTDKRYSIIQPNFEKRICFVCGKPNAEKHEVMFGTAHRKLSIEYGLCVCLCREHHTGTNGVHNNRELDLYLKRIAQTEFEKHYSRDDWLNKFRRNYL